MPKVTFLPANITVEIPETETIIRAAMKAGLHINASCGGAGVCGKCRVFVEGGEVEGEPLPEGGYKACTLYPKSDVTIRIPVESEVDRRALLRPVKKVASAWLEAREAAQVSIDPAIKKIYLKLEPPSLENNMPDLSRLETALLQNLGVERLEVNWRLLRNLPYRLREKNFETTAILFEETPPKLLGVEAGNTTKRHFALAVDIGTTTICAQLVDLVSGKILGETSDYNPQISYGEDVISRIEFARKKDGLKILHEKVIECLGKLAQELCQQNNINPEELSHYSLAGNTVMSHFLLFLEPRFLRESPYVPVASRFPLVPAKDLGLPAGEQTILTLAPCVASYVGGDITAGVVATGMAKEDPLTLFIDIGTNGEIVVGNKDFLACAACSAGPAFEGGGIKHGMRATIGAIEAVSIDPQTLEPMILTIGNKKPKGICGSGIISLLATLFIEGIIDQSGKFRRDLNSPRIREGREGWEYVLVWKEESATGEDIVFTEADIDNLIRAKGAMFSGYQTLLESVGLDITMVERVILAGNFGSFLDLEQAIIIGLLPDLPRENFYFVGNSSLMGARMAALSKEVLAEMERVAQMMTHFELSAHPGYMDYYVSALFLPHTNLDLFPTVKELLQQIG
ncbi:ASKHA domain-containing protein [Thermodesulfatator autotrophicus]|uniref:Ferredoxin n=1 Tax=Thermodesulfatator autotrophicus TaxID=1795632 RepID=A0A177E5C0_9BACT|nr:ASKHA domain-containing protein [Thermodesulfatator autotrophicus]OAG27095.1 ferredoxin [Thermodesulfatator autotrophicus]